MDCNIAKCLGRCLPYLARINPLSRKQCCCMMYYVPSHTISLYKDCLPPRTEGRPKGNQRRKAKGEPKESRRKGDSLSGVIACMLWGPRNKSLHTYACIQLQRRRSVVRTGVHLPQDCKTARCLGSSFDRSCGGWLFALVGWASRKSCPKTSLGILRSCGLAGAATQKIGVNGFSRMIA